MLFSIPIVISAGAIALIVFFTAAQAGVFQRKFHQNGLAVFRRGVQRLVEAGDLVVIRKKEGGDDTPPEQAEPQRDAA